MATKKSNATPVEVSPKSLSEIVAGRWSGQPAYLINVNNEARSLPHYLYEQTTEGQESIAEQTLGLKAMFSKYSARDFDKSAHLQLPFKAAGYAAKGAADFGIGIVDNVRTVGDDINAISAYYSFKNAVDSLSADNEDKKQAALFTDKLVAAGYNRRDIANFQDLDGATDKKGNKLLSSPLSNGSKKLFRLYQEHLKAQEILTQNSRIKDFYQTENDKSYWTTKGFRGGNKTTKLVGEMIGQGGASMAVFGGIGSIPGMAAFKTIRAAHRARKAASFYKAGMANLIVKYQRPLMTASLAAGKAGIFGTSGHMAYKEARDLALSKGWNFEDANTVGLVAAASLGGIETFMNVKWTSKFIREKSPSFMNIITLGALPEGIQEASSEAVSKAIYETTGLQDEAFKDIASDILVSFIGGFVGGGVVGAFGMADLNQEAKTAGLRNYERQQRKAGTYDLAVKKDGEIQEYIMKGEATNVREFGGNIDMEMNRIGLKQEQIGYEQSTIGQDQQAAIGESQKELGQDKEVIDVEAKKTKKLPEMSEAQRHIFDGMKEVYVERAKKNNPKVTDAQIENGWKIVENMMRHELDTGEFTETLDNNIDALIASTDITDEGVRERLKAAKENFGGLSDIDFDTDELYYKLLSKNGREKYDAEWEIAMKHIEDEFAANGSRAQGKLVALIMKRRLYELAAYFKGSPLELVEEIKPQVINLSRARLNGQEVNAAYSILDEMVGKFENMGATLEDTIAAKTNAIEIHNKIKAYSIIKDSEKKKALIKEISLDLFGRADILKTDEDLKDVEASIETRAEQEFAIMDEMGIIDGNSMVLNPEDFEVIALLREMGFSFANIADAFGLSITNRSERDLDIDYSEALKIAFPPLTRKEIRLLSNLPAETREEIKFRDDVGYAKEPEFTSEEESDEMSDEEIISEIEKGEKNKDEIKLSGSQRKLASAIYATDIGETKNGEPLTSFVRPNALYSREGRVIVVKNGVRQGELVHEASHFIITETLLKADELSASLGIEAIGSLKRIYEIIDQNVKKEGRRLTQIEKQETVLDAVVRLAKEGSTGDKELDAIFNELNCELAETIISPEGSVLEEMDEKELGNLGTAIKAFLGDGPISVIKELTSFENELQNLDTTNAISTMEKIMKKYNIPGSEKYYAMLSQLTKDGPENVSLYHLLLLSENFVNDVKVFAGNKILEQENKTARKNRALARSKALKKKTDSVYNDPDVYFFRKKGQSQDNIFDRPIRKDEGPQPFRSKKSYEEEFEEVPSSIKKTFSKAGQGVKSMIFSVVDLVKEMHPEYGSMFEQRMFEKMQNVERWTQPVKNMSSIIDEHNRKTNKNDANFISKEDEKELMKNLRDGGDVLKSFDKIAEKLSPEDSVAFLDSAYDAVANLEEIKNTLTELGALPVSGWRKNYWPFMCNNFDGLCEYFDAFPENPLAKAVAAERERAKAEGLSKPETEMRIIDAINGTIYGKDPESRVTSFHSRASMLLDDGAIEFYADPFTAFIRYTQDAGTTIMNRRMFGNFKENTFAGGDFGRITQRLGLADKIGKLSEKTPEEIKRLSKREQAIYTGLQAIKDYMQRTSTPEAWRKLNDVINTTTIYNFSSAISQVLEYGFNVFMWGLSSATLGLIKAGSKDSLTLADFGLDELNETFREVSHGLFAEVSDFTSRASLFRGFDRYMKRATLNTIWAHVGSILKEGKVGSYKYDRIMKRLDEAFAFAEGDAELAKARKDQVIEDILNNRLTDDVKFFVLSLFENQQPINSISIQSKYNSASPLARLCFYKLNTVQIKQMAAVFKDFKERWQHGKYKDVLSGLLGYIFYLAAVGVPIGVIQDLARFDRPNIKNSLIYSPLQVLGINGYTASLVSQKGIGSALADRFTPPLTFLDEASKPIIGTLKGKDWDEAGYEGWVKLAFSPTGFGAFAKGLYESVVDKPNSIPLDAYGAYEAAIEPFEEAIDGLSNYYI